MEPWILALLALVLAMLVVLIVGRKRVLPLPHGAPERKREPCPLCGAPLAAGEKVHTERFPAGNESIVHILGCPRCRPPGGVYPRTCPVCRATLPAEGYVVGRMWEKRGAADGRPRHHLHVLGCTACRRPAAAPR